MMHHYEVDVEGGHKHGTHNVYLRDEDHHDKMTRAQWVTLLANLIGIGQGVISATRYLGRKIPPK